jgi:hypothetical protein
MGNEVKYPKGMTVVAKTPSGDRYTGIVERYDTSNDTVLVHLTEDGAILKKGHLAYIPESWVVYE